MMVRNSIVIFFIIVFVACNETHENKQEITANLPTVKNDSFELEYDAHLKIPEGIFLDSIVERNKKVDGVFKLVRPRFKSKEFNALEKILLKELDRRTMGDTTQNDGDEKEEEVIGWRQTVEPIHIYKSDKIISYGFTSTYTDSRAGRPSVKYISINYDIQQHKLIRLGDYFKTETKSDTLLLTYVIYAAVGEADNKYNSARMEYGFDNSFDFTIDDNKLYFYFDQFAMGLNPMGLEGSAKRKYITGLIRNEYR